MKSRKMLTRIILIVAMLFAIMLVTNQSHAVAIAAAAGLVTILVSVAQWTCVGIGIAGQTIIFSITSALGGEHTNVWNLTDVIFNRSTSTTAAYFADPNGFKMGIEELASKGPMIAICESVSNFYYIIRNLSIAVLLFVLLYIGIRMAISTVASEEAKYKKMLGNWAVSMALIFVLHYIMILTLYCNNILVEVLWEFVDTNKFESFVLYGMLAVEGLVPYIGIGEAIVFMMLIGIELTFLFMYIKRIITLGFLIVIAPLITITYSIDKAGDGKSQALNTWLKEFIFTVLIQPFHCIIYIVLVQTVLGKMVAPESIGACVIYILMLKFMKEAEGIVKKIFGIQSDSMPGHSAMGALALGLFSQFAGKKGGKKGGSGEKSSKTMPNMRGEQTGRNRTGANTPDSNPPTPTPTPTPNPPTPDSNPPTPEPNPPTPDPDSNPPTPDPDANPPMPDSQDAQPGFFQRKIKSVDTALENKFGKKYKDYKRDLNVMKKRLVGDSYLKKGAQYGAGLAALGLGLGMADEKTAIAAAIAAKSGTESIQDTIEDINNHIQLEDNEDVFKEKYANAVDDYMTRISATGVDITYEDAEDYINQQFESMDKNTLTKKELSAHPILKELIEAREDMKDSYEIAGESPDAMVKRLSAQAMAEKKEADIRNGRTY